jgi:hypothetical protein
MAWYVIEHPLIAEEATAEPEIDPKSMAAMM